jgi:large subunit ribosomal protein L23
MNPLYNIIKRPLVTEKSSLLAETQGCYFFEVNKNSTKSEIKQAVEALFGVKVQRVNTSVVHGKVKTVGKFQTKRSNWKKAMVYLKEGQKIALFQAGQQK